MFRKVPHILVQGHFSCHLNDGESLFLIIPELEVASFKARHVQLSSERLRQSLKKLSL